MKHDILKKEKAMFRRELEDKTKELQGKVHSWLAKDKAAQDTVKEIEKLKQKLEQQRKEADSYSKVVDEGEAEISRLCQMITEKDKQIAEEFTKPRQI